MRSGLLGSKMIRPMWWLPSSPACRHVAPWSSLTYAPSPTYELRDEFTSPDPTTTRPEGWAATAPIMQVSSRRGSNVVPWLMLFHSPPVAYATYIVSSTTATSTTRPLMTDGPTFRSSSPLVQDAASKTARSSATPALTEAGVDPKVWAQIAGPTTRHVAATRTRAEVWEREGRFMSAWGCCGAGLGPAKFFWPRCRPRLG